MRNALKTLVLTLACLVAIDVLVAVALTLPVPSSLKQFFEYGRSVPGKLAQWQENPDMPANLLRVAWQPAIVSGSARAFAEEDPGQRRLRLYGFSFANHISEALAARRPDLPIDRHSGPGAPPNFTYSLAAQDRANRRPGDVVVWAVLSSSTPAMSSFSNRVWAFEQPSPFTYPVYRLAEGGGLRREDPVVVDLDDQLALDERPELAARWSRQLRERDGLYTAAAFGAPWLDISPFSRLIRRARATNAIAEREDAITARPDAAPYPYAEVLRRMARDFAAEVRADGQVPVVMLVQTGDLGSPDLRALLAPYLREHDIPYFATADYQDPADPSVFLPDGHYTYPVNERFGAEFDRFLQEVWPAPPASATGQ